MALPPLPTPPLALPPNSIIFRILCVQKNVDSQSSVAPPIKLYKMIMLHVPLLLDMSGAKESYLLSWPTSKFTE